MNSSASYSTTQELPKGLSPKYCQVIDMILDDINQKVFKPGDRIPSIKETSEEQLLSRDTVEKAYRELSQRGVLISVPGKGYFVNGKTARTKLRIMVLVPRMTAFTQSFYGAFVQTLGKHAVSHLYLYQHCSQTFAKRIEENLGEYDFYVVLPAYDQDDKAAKRALRKLPKSKTITLAPKGSQQTAGHEGVLGNIKQTISKTLEEIKGALARYEQIHFVLPPHLPRTSPSLEDAFAAAAQKLKLPLSVCYDCQEPAPQPGHAYLFWNEQCLIPWLAAMKSAGLTPGQDLGVLSFHDSPIKQVLGGGISVIHLDPEEIGKQSAAQILQNRKEPIQPSWRVIERSSL